MGKSSLVFSGIRRLRSKKVIDLIRAMSVFDVLLITCIVLAIFFAPFVFSKGTTTQSAPPKIDSINPTSGPIGTSITLLGSRFSASNSIVIQGKEILSGIPSTLNGTRIDFTLPLSVPCKPPNACAIKVYVNNSKGISNAAPFKVTWPVVPTSTPMPIPSPTPFNLIIKGRFVDKFTLAPIPDVAIQKFPNTIGSILVDKQPNGEFSVTTSSEGLRHDVTSYHEFLYYPSCYFYADRLGIEGMPVEGYSAYSDRFDDIVNFIRFPVTSEVINSGVIDIGDVPVWPAVSLWVHSDKEVQVSYSYRNHLSSGGSGNFQFDHGIGGGVIPLNFSGTTITLTDRNGNNYTAPPFTRSLDKGCSMATLNFVNGVFSWD